MATPKYFSNFPDIQYAISANKAGIPSYIAIKDYFHLLVPRDDTYREDTLYVEYIVENGQRPDQISYEEYGDEQYYWVILQINQITDYYNQWPLSQNELTEYIYNKYGGLVGAAQIHHWETVETFDDASTPNLVLPGGLVVPATFKYTYPQIPGETTYETSFPISVTNQQYEERLNDAKSAIFILDPQYLADYAREVRVYGRNIEPQRSYADISSVLVR